MVVTEKEARMKVCPVMSPKTGLLNTEFVMCQGSACMLWEFAAGAATYGGYCSLGTQRKEPE